ncbi:MAG: hypothetical protein ACJAR9_001554 [Celeribacter sp.]|jgi:hypothetical protein
MAKIAPIGGHLRLVLGQWWVKIVEIIGKCVLAQPTRHSTGVSFPALHLWLHGYTIMNLWCHIQKFYQVVK